MTVIAPAGYGKTTLLETWAEASQVRTAVVPLASIHDSVSALGLHLAESIAPRVPEAADLSDLADAAAAPDADWARVLLPRLVRALSRVHVAIALDDVHVLTEPKALELLNTFIAVLPPHVTLLLVGRSLPEVPLAKVALDGRLLEIAAADLEISPGELRSLRRLGLPEQDLQRIFQATGGWPVGVRMEVMQRVAAGDSAGRTVLGRQGSESNGTSSWLLGTYLEEEVLSDLEADRLSFLRDLAVLTPVDSEILGSVRGAGDTKEMLRRLRTEPVPMVSLRPARAGQVVVMHPLLSEHFAEHHPLPTQDRQRLLVRLASVHADRGNLDESFEAVRQAGDTEALARFVYTNSILTILTGRTAVVRRWLAYFPEEQLRRHPQLALTWLAINAIEGDGITAEQWLESFGQWAAEPGAVIWPEENVDIGALFTEALSRDGITEGWKAATSSDTIWAAIVATLEGHKLTLDGQWAEAEALLLTAITTESDLGLNDIWRLSVLAYVYEQLGQPERADECAARCEEILDRWDLHNHKNTFSDHVSMAAAAWRAGDLARARALITSGMLKMSQTRGREDSLVTAYLGLARVAVEIKAHDLANTCVREARELMSKAGNAPVLVAQLEDLVRRNPRSIEPDTSGSHGMSAAELRVLQFLGSFYPVPRIAEELSVSPATVRTHIRAIYRKLAVHDRVDAVTTARERGLIN